MFGNKLLLRTLTKDSVFSGTGRVDFLILMIWMSPFSNLGAPVVIFHVYFVL